MTDMTEQRDVDMVIDGAIKDAVMARGMVTTVAVEDAAVMAGVSVRALRRWIQYAHLPHIEDENARRVSPEDLPRQRRARRVASGTRRASTRMLSPRSGAQQGIGAMPVCQRKSSL
jgi:hypothetical protein